MRILITALVFGLLGISCFGQITYTVNVTDDIDDGVCDSNHCSFREALILSESDGAASQIDFNINVTNIATIDFMSELPKLNSDSLLINGLSQANNSPFDKKLVFNFESVVPFSSAAHLDISGNYIDIVGVVFRNSNDQTVISNSGYFNKISFSYFYNNFASSVIEVFGDLTVDNCIFNKNNTAIGEITDWGICQITNNYFGYIDSLTTGLPKSNSISLGMNTYIFNNFFYGNLAYGPFISDGASGTNLNHLTQNQFD